jgi:2-aminobenzoylacetyl-CoA thioesterase
MANIFPRQVTDDLWILGNNYFYIYLIKGSNACALVETGISATVDTLLEQLSRIGEKPDFLIVTHPHSDHITGLDHLRSYFPRATVITGKGAELFISHPKTEQSMILEDRHMTESMAAQGLSGRRPAITSVPSLSGCRLVNGIEKLDLGGLSVCLREVKGHSPGNIAVYIPGIKTILASDSLGNYYPGRGFFPTFFTGFTDYLETINNLEKLNPLNLGLAHNGFFSDSEEIGNIFYTARKSALDVEGYIVNDKRTEQEIAEDLFRFYYNDELKIYSPQNIFNCCRLLVRRIREL